ncbi:hypothetical protein ACQP25_40770 [Microtetraspora malaysiensis]|uniref:hypothetical protein n=1 Tax=Microtetraspora malaysiensis TaxID=161358 RepID=UPI003D8AC3FF
MPKFKSVIAGLAISTAMTGGAVALGATTTATTANAAVVQAGWGGGGGGWGRGHRNRNWNRNHNRNREHQNARQQQRSHQRQNLINNITIRITRQLLESLRRRDEGPLEAPEGAFSGAPIVPVG